MTPNPPDPTSAAARTGSGDAVCLSSSSAADVQTSRPPHQNTQIKFQVSAETDFDADIALALTASGWRATAALLTHAAKCIEAGDFQSAENNRRQAREQFVAANDVFRQFREARAAEGASLWAEAFR